VSKKRKLERKVTLGEKGTDKQQLKKKSERGMHGRKTKGVREEREDSPEKISAAEKLEDKKVKLSETLKWGVLKETVKE